MAEPGAAGWEDTLDDDYDNSTIRKDIDIMEPTFIPKSYTLPHETKYNASPELPFKDHPYPSLINLSNKFRQKGPNKIMYPPKNGPVAMIKKYGGNPSTDLPPYDPFDELTYEIEQNIKQKYEHELRSLYAMQHTNELQNIRALNRHGSLVGAQQEISEIKNHKYPGIYIGDIVIRGPDWTWGNQDGGKGLKGTIRGIRQWHPLDTITNITEVIVLWDHGLYGNYRYNYRGAYDICVIGRLNLQSSKMEPICIGDVVCRKQVNWRWGDQDGGTLNANNGQQTYDGTIIELYASPAPFEGGARIAVCWDHKKKEWREKATGYKMWMENEEKNGVFNDLNLDQFEYKFVADHDNKNHDEKKEMDNQEDEKKSEEPEQKQVFPAAKNDNDTIVSPSSTGKGARLKTFGITTDDPWPMKDDYKEWDIDSTAQWVRELNEDFDDYGDTIEDCDLNGRNFKEFELMNFWMDKISVKNEKHAKALAAAAKYRIEQYEIEKNKPIQEDEKIDEPAPKPFQVDEPPKAFQWDIPEMDESLLDQFHHLIPPSNNNLQSGSDNDMEGEGGNRPGLSDNENQEQEVDVAVAASVDPGSVPVKDMNVKPNVAVAASMDPGSVPVKDMNVKGNDNRKKLYFWQMVIEKEEKLMDIFSKTRAKDEYFHITRYQYGMSKNKDMDNKENNDSEDEYEWKEPDFDELLSKPIPKYRWGIQYNYDLQIDEAKEYVTNREYLMIDDRVKRGKDFIIDEKIGNYKSDFGIVLKIEQWDDTRLDNNQIRGDKIYLTWSSFRPFRFNYNGIYDIDFFKRGQVFASDYSHIRVGDRVSRGFSWTDDRYNNQDGGQGGKGTVVAVQYVLQVTGIIAKVQWHKNNHINLYSWGFKNVYDIRRVAQ